MAITPILFMITLVRYQDMHQDMPQVSNCTTTLIDEVTNFILCSTENDYTKYLPEIVNKTISPAALVNKFCNTLNPVGCLKSFANATQDCFDDRHKKGLQIGVEAATDYYALQCSQAERQKFIDRLTNEPKCDATSATAFAGCGSPDIMGFIFPYNKKGCGIMKKQFGCALGVMKLSGFCSDTSLNSFASYFKALFDATPCGKKMMMMMPSL